jgi:cytochrome c
MTLIYSLLTFLLLGFAAQAQEPAERGRALLAENCARCHAIGKTGDSPHEGAPPFRKVVADYDLDTFADRLQRGIFSGHPDMPEFRFNEDDAHAIVAYLRTIQP